MIKKFITTCILVYLTFGVVFAQTNPSPKFLTISSSDSIKVLEVFISSFDNKVFSIKEDFQNIPITKDFVNIKVIGLETYESGSAHQAAYFLTGYKMKESKQEIIIDKSYGTSSYYKEQVCFTDQSFEDENYEIKIVNPQDQYIFKLAILKKGGTLNMWNGCFDYLDNMEKFIAPNSEKTIKVKGLRNARNSTFVVATFIPFNEKRRIILKEVQKVEINNKVITIYPKVWEHPKTVQKKEKTVSKVYKYYGYMDGDSKMKRYDQVTNFPAGRIVKLNYKYGFVDTGGILKIPIKFTSLKPFLNPKESFIAEVCDERLSYFVFRKGSDFGIIDENEEVIIEPKYKSPINKNGFTATYEKAVQLDANGKIISDNTEKLKIVKKDNLYGLCKNNNCDKIDYKYRMLKWNLECQSYIADDTTGNVILLDDMGKIFETFPRRGLYQKVSRFFYFTDGGRCLRVYDLKQKKWIIPNQKRFNWSFLDDGMLVYATGTNERFDSFYISDFYGNMIVSRSDVQSYEANINVNLFIGTNDQKENTLFDINGNTIFEYGIYDEIKKHNDLYLLTKGDKKGIYFPEDDITVPCIIDSFKQYAFMSTKIEAIIDGKENLIQFENGEYKLVPIE